MAAARGREASLRRAIREALRAGTPPARLDEALLQLVPFAGYARAINAFSVLRELSPHRPRPARVRGGLRRRGEALCRRIYGPVYGRLMAKMRSFHPDLAAWIVEDGYGKVLSRPILTVVERELLVVAVLAALKLPLQLDSHVRGALRVGASKADVDAMRRL
ncbi:MAG TPA: carboxymuconolactone decarboxylase family protein [Planctomycetota bacterium]|nr:carboxymuconolactone decarboxylase family protein [Planctomycetota bacterium]